MGIEEVAHKTVKTYSGGMVRRLEIACALLVGKPRVLFLDEPTIGLDPSARKAVWQNLISFKKEYGTTVFFNTHYMDEVDLIPDEIAIINKGKIVKSVITSELKQSLRSEIIRISFDVCILWTGHERYQRSGLRQRCGHYKFSSGHCC